MSNASVNVLVSLYTSLYIHVELFLQVSYIETGQLHQRAWTF